jgi:hypothetical protein
MSEPLEINIIELKNVIDGLMSLAPTNARAVRVYYNALVAEGFTPAEALKIVLSHGYAPPPHGKIRE